MPSLKNYALSVNRCRSTRPGCSISPLKIKPGETRPFAIHPNLDYAECELFDPGAQDFSLFRVPIEQQQIARGLMKSRVYFGMPAYDLLTATIVLLVQWGGAKADETVPGAPLFETISTATRGFDLKKNIVSITRIDSGKYSNTYAAEVREAPVEIDCGFDTLDDFVTVYPEEQYFPQAFEEKTIDELAGMSNEVRVALALMNSKNVSKTAPTL